MGLSRTWCQSGEFVLECEKIRTLKNKQTAALSAVTKKRNEVSDYMTSQDMLHLVKTNFEEFNDLCTVYQRFLALQNKLPTLTPGPR